MELNFDTFVFAHRAIDNDTVRLGYRLEGPSGRRCAFEERLVLGEAIPPEVAEHPAVAAALAGLHTMAGISYWKTCCPRRMVFESGAPAAWEVPYWNEVYTQGLGEFFFRNGIDPVGRVSFPSGGAPRAASGEAPLLDRGVFVLVGGGKDSVVSIEATRASGEPVDVLSIGDSPWIRRAARASRLNHVVVKRRLDPGLFELNAAGALNGHVPISAYLAHASLLVALMTGRSAVIASNERSASQGNLMFHGMEVNHQWSKGLRFETLFQQWAARSMSGEPKYFSLMRPLSELRIAKAFSRHTEYFGDVTSCNANFRANDDRDTERWCGRCPKCVFVFTIIAPFLDDDAIGQLFGRSFFEDPENIEVLERLTARVGHKPFECVGTPEETIAALWLSAAAGRGQGMPVMRWFEEQFSPPQGRDQIIADVMRPSPEHRMTPRWERVLNDYLQHH